VQIERPVNLFDHVARAIGFATDDDAIRTAKIFDRRAFPQEFRVRRHVEIRPGRILRMIFSTLRPVPTGTVDLVTTTV